MYYVMFKNYFLLFSCRYLKFAITDFEKTRIRKQDSTTVFAAVYNSGLLGAKYVLDFVEKYHKEMEK